MAGEPIPLGGRLLLDFAHDLFGDLVVEGLESLVLGGLHSTQTEVLNVVVVTLEVRPLDLLQCLLGLLILLYFLVNLLLKTE